MVERLGDERGNSIKLLADVTDFVWFECFGWEEGRSPLTRQKILINTDIRKTYMYISKTYTTVFARGVPRVWHHLNLPLITFNE